MRAGTTATTEPETTAATTAKPEAEPYSRLNFGSESPTASATKAPTAPATASPTAPAAMSQPEATADTVLIIGWNDCL